MPVPLIPCRNAVTGAETVIPETALRHMPDWEPIPGDDTAAAAAPSTAGDTAPPAASDRPAASAAGKSKAAKATTTLKED